MSFEEFEKKFDEYMNEYTGGLIQTSRPEKLMMYMAAYVLVENYNKEINELIKYIGEKLSQ